MLDQSVDNNQTCVEDGDQLHYVYNEEEDQNMGFNRKAMKKFNSPLKMDSKFWTMATSSNGLICSTHQTDPDDSYLLYIYNPFLGEYVTLPNNFKHSAESSMESSSKKPFLRSAAAAEAKKAAADAKNAQFDDKKKKVAAAEGSTEKPPLTAKEVLQKKILQCYMFIEQKDKKILELKLLYIRLKKTMEDDLIKAELKYYEDHKS